MTVITLAASGKVGSSGVVAALIAVGVTVARIPLATSGWATG
jgi:hypothetical protein